MNEDKVITKQFLVTPALGKRLIAKSIASLPEIEDALKNKTIVIIAGTTNAYVAEELLEKVKQLEDFSKKRFFRGVTLPPNYRRSTEDGAEDKGEFLGDVVIDKGRWLKRKTIFDVVDDLREGDIIIKGANALNLENQQAGIYIGHPKGGTIGAAMQAVVGRRVKLYLPVGLEKRILGDINRISQKLNSSNTIGPRMWSVSGEIITEQEAINIMTGAEVELVASGGICGAEGSCWLAVSGSHQQIDQVEDIIREYFEEPNFKI
ncbi:hypothetical protein U472_02765 [Orenia metallireducens]|uniref:Uncharacterized protein n=1 Tax=Orenia metallireducens TaxID=1413210 RepID=A0A1C0ACN3_9FIRM|nr:hypothetical protein [Orenia metallireducens]OCL28128.1 hypothetical protein U472_02765 [Orenia metallireducens]